jgi:hypothetical protein
LFFILEIIRAAISHVGSLRTSNLNFGTPMEVHPLEILMVAERVAKIAEGCAPYLREYRSESG